MQIIIDELKIENSKTLIRLFIKVIILLILMFISGCIQVYVNSRIIKLFHINAKNDLFNCLIANNTDDNYNVGEKINIFENDLAYMEEYYFDNILSISKNFIVLVLSISYLLFINIKWGIVLIVMIIMLLIFPLFLGKKIDKIGEECSNLKGNYLENLQEFFEGKPLINVFSIEKRVSSFLYNKILKLENKTFKFNNDLGIYSQVLIVGNYCVIVMSLVFGGIMVIKHIITIGELIAATQLLNLILQPIGEIATAFIEIIGCKTIKLKLERILSIPLCNKTEDVKGQFCDISIRNLSYKISEKTIINNINLNIEKNCKYVIIGASGSGKTTLLKLIANILKPNNGDRYINGYSYAEAVNYINQNIIYVSQDTFLFNDTVENNIKLYRNFSDKAYNRAIRISDIRDKAISNNNYLKSEFNISGGEKQRIAIARAIILNPSVMLFDEITSSLDHKTADKILNNLLELDNTMIFVTHKLHKKMIETADKIICIENGTIVEEGTFSSLINRKEYFFNIYYKENI